ncbi:hypothetical protein [Methanosarcina sp. MSH10X1]|nr:hypothetical protein [Methanosarcina sp. MSH10X1]
MHAICRASNLYCLLENAFEKAVSLSLTQLMKRAPETLHPELYAA